MNLSLRLRLLLAYVGLILAGFTILALLVGRQISSGTVQDFARQLEEQARVVARALADSVEDAEDGKISTVAMRRQLQTYADQTNTVVVLTDDHGRFWLSSHSESGQTDTPEIRAARSGRISSETRNGIVYTAAPIWEDDDDDDDLIGVVQLSAPLSETAALVQQRWGGLIGVVLGVTAVAAAAAFWLATTLTHPLEALRQAALQMAQGNFAVRLPHARQDEIGQVAQAFNHMGRQVEAMLAEQRAFVGNASHELRTPLTTIRLRSEALREGTLDPATASRYVVEIDDEVQRLGGLVQDLMLLSQIDAGRQEAGHEQIDPVRLARQLLREIEPAAQSRQITLSLDAPESLPSLTAGYNHLAIVFRNLLNNALKYSLDGGQITWHLAQAGEGIRHTIHDTGQGIAAADLLHVFDRFYRADKSRSRATPGVGLGLSLVRQVVTLYGGEVEIKSDGVGQGTAVSIWWPFS